MVCESLSTSGKGSLTSVRESVGWVIMSGDGSRLANQSSMNPKNNERKPTQNRVATKKRVQQLAPPQLADGSEITYQVHRNSAILVIRHEPFPQPQPPKRFPNHYYCIRHCEASNAFVSVIIVLLEGGEVVSVLGIWVIYKPNSDDCVAVGGKTGFCGEFGCEDSESI